LFERLYDTFTPEFVEECSASALSKKRLTSLSKSITLGREEDFRYENEDENKRDSSGSVLDDVGQLYEKNEDMQKESISTIQRKREELLGQIWKQYDDGSKGYLDLNDMRNVVSGYLRVVLRFAPSRTADQAIVGAKIGTMIARKRNMYVAALSDEVIDEFVEKTEAYLKLLRTDIENGVKSMLTRLLQPTTLIRISKEIFDTCDAGTKDGWISEFEFKNCFLHALHKVVEWNEVFATVTKTLPASNEKKSMWSDIL